MAYRKKRLAMVMTSGLGKCFAVAIEHALDHRLLGKVLEDPFTQSLGAKLRGSGVFERGRDAVRKRGCVAWHEQRLALRPEDLRDAADPCRNHRNAGRSGLDHNIGHG